VDDQWLQDIHDKLCERFTKFKDLECEIRKRAKRYYYYGTSVHLTIIILGAVSAAQATVKDQMGADGRSIILLFSVLATLMTITAGLESSFKWSHKSGALCSLAAMCAVFQYKMHDRWSKVASEWATQPDERSLYKMRKLAYDDLADINRKIIEIQKRASELGVTGLALKDSSLRSEDMFRVPPEYKRPYPSSDGNGRPVGEYSNEDRDLAGRGA